MKNNLFTLILSIFFLVSFNVFAQSDSTNMEKPKSYEGPIQKGAFTVGGGFSLSENTQRLELGLGYFFTDRIGLGVDAILVNDVFNLQIIPRYYFPILDNTYLFVEVGVNLGAFSVNGGAGVTYFLNERVGVQGRLNNFNGGGIGLFVLFPGKSKRKN